MFRCPRQLSSVPTIRREERGEEWPREEWKKLEEGGFSDEGRLRGLIFLHVGMLIGSPAKIDFWIQTS